MRAVPGGATVFALTTVMALDTSDQSAIGATAPQVRAAFDIGQTQIGVLATSSTLIGVLFTIPFGILADRTNRVRLLRRTVVVWTVAMVFVGASPNFGLMLVAHAVLGLVSGAGGPLIASIIGDLVPRAQRGRAFSALLLGELAGSAIGLALSGEIAALIGWREAYWVLAVAGLVALAMLTQAREPARRVDARLPIDAGDGTVHDDAVTVSFGEALRLLARNRTYLVIVAASSLGYYFFAGVQTFAVSLLGEAYHVSATAAPLLVVLIASSLAVGVLVGGPVGDRMLRRSRRAGRLPLVVVAFAGSLVFIVPALASSQLWVTLPLLVTGGILLGSANPALDATRIEIVPSRLLGRAEALRTAIKDGADASAPLLFGVLGAGIGLQSTFLLMTTSLGLALLFCLAAVRSYPRDISGVAAAPATGTLAT